MAPICGSLGPEGMKLVSISAFVLPGDPKRSEIPWHQEGSMLLVLIRRFSLKSVWLFLSGLSF